LLDSNDIYGAGFTLIVGDDSAGMGLPKLDESELAEFEKQLQELLSDYNFSIQIICSNEDAVRFQGRMLINKMLNKMDELTKGE
jgi:hypothetical protein